MRGTRIASSVGQQRATAVARPMSGNVHLLHPRLMYAVTVGESGNFRGYIKATAGDMEPKIWANREILSIYSNSTNVMIVDAAADPFEGVNSLQVTVEGFGVVILPWNAVNDEYRQTIPGMFDFLNSRIGDVLGVRLSKAS